VGLATATREPPLWLDISPRPGSGRVIDGHGDTTAAADKGIRSSPG